MSMMTRIRAIAAGCNLQSLADIEAERIEECLRSLRSQHDLSSRTYNHYLQAFKSFSPDRDDSGQPQARKKSYSRASCACLHVCLLHGSSETGNGKSFGAQLSAR